MIRPMTKVTGSNISSGKRFGRRLAVSLAAGLLAFGVLPQGAAMAQENELAHDARLEGYKEPVALEEGNLAMTWLGFGFLSAIALLGLFKDAKRSHLD